MPRLDARGVLFLRCRRLQLCSCSRSLSGRFQTLLLLLLSSGPSVTLVITSVGRAPRARPLHGHYINADDSCSF